MHPDPELGKTQGKEKFFGFSIFWRASAVIGCP